MGWLSEDSGKREGVTVHSVLLCPVLCCTAVLYGEGWADASYEVADLLHGF